MTLSIRKPAAVLAAFAALVGSSMIAPAPAAALETTCYYERTTTTVSQGGLVISETVETRLLFCITTPS